MVDAETTPGWRVARDCGACPPGPAGRPVGSGKGQAPAEVAGLAAGAVQAIVPGQNLAVAEAGRFQVRAFDATIVKEPGRSGSVWRIHYSVRLRSVTCDYFKLTKTVGAGTGESLAQYPIAPGDCILAHRGNSTAKGIHYAVEAGGQVTVPANSGWLVLAGRTADPRSCGVDEAAADSRDHRVRVGAGCGRPGRVGAEAGLRVAQDRGCRPPGLCENQQGRFPHGTLGPVGHAGAGPVRHIETPAGTATNPRRLK